uniref:Propeptide, peptidase M4 and M36 n=1 Tax=Solibacter usitatus (strain Ellin6076) TaxID=234267 RepID=Q029C9_SOLUE
MTSKTSELRTLTYGAASRSLAIALIIAGAAAGQDAANSQQSLPAKQTGITRLPGVRVTDAQRQALAQYGPNVRIEFNSQDVPSSITGRIGNRAQSADPAAEANAVLEANGAAFRRGPDDGFVFSALETDNHGGQHVHMAQTYKGVRVTGGELVVDLESDYVSGISGHFFPDLQVDTDSAPVPDSTIAGLVKKTAHQNARMVRKGDPVILADRGQAGQMAIPVRIASDGTEGNDAEDLMIDAIGGHVLSRQIITSLVPGAPANLLLNPGFESQTANWTGQHYVHPTTAGSYYYLPPICGGPATVSAAKSGFYYACLGGHGVTSTDIVAQNITAPKSAYTGTLSFWLQIGTQESTSATTAYDTLTVQIYDQWTGKTLSWVYSNLNATYFGNYQLVQLPFSASSFAGHPLTVRFTSQEDYSLATRFNIDDTSISFGALVL